MISGSKPSALLHVTVGKGLLIMGERGSSVRPDQELMTRGKNSHTTHTIRLCHGIFTNRSIFRLPFSSRNKASSNLVPRASLSMRRETTLGQAVPILFRRGLYDVKLLSCDWSSGFYGNSPFVGIQSKNKSVCENAVLFAPSHGSWTGY